MRSVCLIMLCLCALPAQGVIEAYEFESPRVEAEYNELIKELRCLVCQNQNLADSDADLAKDLRRQTHQMLSAGKSPQQVVEFMVERYGDFVLYRPQFKASTWLLWLGPFVLLLCVLALLIWRLRAVARDSEVDADALAQARRLLEEDESRT